MVPLLTNARPRRVLIVDDAQAVRTGLRTILELAGAIEIVGEAGDGVEALSRAAELKPEVILMDLEMPILDGYQATRRIKTQYPACRVIALTVHDYAEARARAAQSGVDAFIVKGSPLADLLNEIHKE